MTLTAIGLFALGALLYKIAPARWRGWGLLVASVIAIYWLQPRLAIRPLDFIFPTATLLIGVIGWLMTREDGPIGRENVITLGLMAALVIALVLVGDFTALTPSPPPDLVDVLIALGGVGLVVAAFAPLMPDRRKAIPAVTLLVILVFIVLKTDPLRLGLAQWLRAQAGRPIYLAQADEIKWLGFSYVAFRLIHTLRDRQSGKLPALSLREYITYLIFFPAFTAGPIDRAERFVKDYRADVPLDAPRAVEGGSRIVIGIFKKFVVAASITPFVLDAIKAQQALGSGGMWLLVYGYSLQIFFDFSGYSDIAIGLGRLFGINLPENFDRPYLKDNLTAFWQSWHMTLSTWVRNYVFTPLSRWLMLLPRKPSTSLAVLISQVTTMVVIGLWHGITPNFVIWGVWHGVGLWLHKLFTDRTRVFYQNLSERPRLRRAANFAGTLLTFHYVALGWVWFALPDPGLSLLVLRRLFGG